MLHFKHLVMFFRRTIIPLAAVLLWSTLVVPELSTPPAMLLDLTRPIFCQSTYGDQARELKIMSQKSNSLLHWRNTNNKLTASPEKEEQMECGFVNKSLYACKSSTSSLRVQIHLEKTHWDWHRGELLWQANASVQWQYRGAEYASSCRLHSQYSLIAESR